MSSDPDAQRWRVQRAATLELRRWDGETVVYDPLPGSTHLLDPTCAAVLDCLLGAESTTSGIARALAGAFDANTEQDVLEAVRAALARLRQADLIRPADP